MTPWAIICALAYVKAELWKQGVLCEKLCVCRAQILRCQKRTFSKVIAKAIYLPSAQMVVRCLHETNCCCCYNSCETHRRGNST